MRLLIFECLFLVVLSIAQDESTVGTTATMATSATVTPATEATTPTVTMGTDGTTVSVWAESTTVTMGTEGTTVSVWAESTTVPTVVETTAPTIMETTTTIETTVTPTTVPTTTPSGDPRCIPGCNLELESLTVSSMKYFPTNCSTVCTNTTLRIGYECDMTEKQLNETLKNMKNLVGGLLIVRSKFKSARFLANLETLDCRNLWEFKVSLNDKMTELGMVNLMQVSCRVIFSSNPNMTRLNVPKLTPVLSSYYENYTLDVDIAYNAPNFCITLEEMSNFMTYDYIKFALLQGSYCPISPTTSSEPKTCDLQNYTWSNMSPDCVIVYGDVILDEANEEHAPCFENVEQIFGSLFIYSTNLSSIDFLGKLRSIVSLTEDLPALIVESNSWLTNVSFPSLERVYSRAYIPVRFDNNSLELIKDPSFCYDIRNGITNSASYIVKFDDKVCEDVEKAAAALVVKDKASRDFVLHPILIVMALIVTLGI